MVVCCESVDAAKRHSLEQQNTPSAGSVSLEGKYRSFYNRIKEYIEFSRYNCTVRPRIRGTPAQATLALKKQDLRDINMSINKDDI